MLVIADIDRMRRVGQSELFQQNRDFAAIWGSSTCRGRSIGQYPRLSAPCSRRSAHPTGRARRMRGPTARMALPICAMIKRRGGRKLRPQANATETPLLEHRNLSPRRGVPARSSPRQRPIPLELTQCFGVRDRPLRPACPRASCRPGYFRDGPLPGPTAGPRASPALPVAAPAGSSFLDEFGTAPTETDWLSWSCKYPSLNPGSCSWGLAAACLHAGAPSCPPARMTHA